VDEMAVSSNSRALIAGIISRAIFSEKEKKRGV
jgi:hypothetical protein